MGDVYSMLFTLRCNRLVHPQTYIKHRKCFYVTDQVFSSLFDLDFDSALLCEKRVVHIFVLFFVSIIYSSEFFWGSASLASSEKTPLHLMLMYPPHWTLRKWQHLLAQVDWPISAVMATKADILAKRAQRTLRQLSHRATRATADGSLLKSQSFAACYIWRDRTCFPAFQFTTST